MKIFRSEDDPQDKAEDFDKISREAEERAEKARHEEDEKRWGPRAK